jgi:hypothetical protein
MRKESIKKKHKLNQSIQYLILFNQRYFLVFQDYIGLNTVF